MNKHSLKGLNLGGWLVLERWITPSLFRNTTASDEYSLCSELGINQAMIRLEKHRKNFITTDDFKWIKDHGIDAIRIPVGYWIFGGDKPYIGAIKFLDFAFRQAEELELKVIIDLHAAAGSQNGKQHSGHQGLIEWDKSLNQIKSLQVIERLAKRYGESPSLYGIELLNEPDRNIPKRLLKDFYIKGYNIVRKYCNETVAVIISDQFRPLRWRKGLGRRYRNIELDIHLYQIFGNRDKLRKGSQQLRIVRYVWWSYIWLTQLTIPVIVGEWSAVSNKSGALNRRKYMSSQIEVYSTARLWCYWTYKTESDSLWSYRTCIDGLKLTLHHK